MKIIWFLIQKELRQIFRNKAMLPLLTVIPIVQLILLSYAASHEVKNVKVAILDRDQSGWSAQLTNKIKASHYFLLAGTPQSEKAAADLLKKDAADIILNISSDFEKAFYTEDLPRLQLLVNSINGTRATLGAAYLRSVILDFFQEKLPELQPEILIRETGSVTLKTSYWYNPELDYKTFMVPGILGVLVTIIVMILSAMNVVREREIGTIEQINVSPIQKHEFILGKLIPFLFIGLILLAVGLTVGKLLFDIPVEGSLLLIFGFCVVLLIAVLGIGLFISTLARTQQQAMFIAWFFMVIFILMSGLFTPIDSMPRWAQYMTIPNPFAHFVEVMRRVLLKGSTFSDILPQFLTVVSLGVVFNTLAVWSYRKTV